MSDYTKSTNTENGDDATMSAETAYGKLNDEEKQLCDDLRELCSQHRANDLLGLYRVAQKALIVRTAFLVAAPTTRGTARQRVLSDRWVLLCAALRLKPQYLRDVSRLAEAWPEEEVFRREIVEAQGPGGYQLNFTCVKQLAKLDDTGRSEWRQECLDNCYTWLEFQGALRGKDAPPSVEPDQPDAAEADPKGGDASSSETVSANQGTEPQGEADDSGSADVFTVALSGDGSVMERLSTVLRRVAGDLSGRSDDDVRDMCAAAPQDAPAFLQEVDNLTAQLDRLGTVVREATRLQQAA